jgi:predicted methyltransferase
MFHYIGNPTNRQGANLTKIVAKRLPKDSFAKVVLAPKPSAVSPLSRLIQNYIVMFSEIF